MIWWSSLMARWGNLLGQDLLCEVVLHVTAEGPPKMYVSKLGSQEDARKVIDALLVMTNNFAKEHHVGINYAELHRAFPFPGGQPG